MQCNGFLHPSRGLPLSLRQVARPPFDMQGRSLGGVDGFDSRGACWLLPYGTAQNDKHFPSPLSHCPLVFFCRPRTRKDMQQILKHVRRAKQIRAMPPSLRLCRRAPSYASFEPGVCRLDAGAKSRGTAGRRAPLISQQLQHLTHQDRKVSLSTPRQPRAKSTRLDVYPVDEKKSDRKTGSRTSNAVCS